MRVREPILVEEVLPLCHHALFFVVEDDDFHVDAELRGGGELGHGHVEGGVAVDIDDEGGWSSDFGADGGGEAEAHGPEPAGGDEGAGLTPAVVLGGPHLVLADAGGDDG